MAWHPTLTVRSERPAWRQVARAVVAAACVLGLFVGAGWAKGVWNRHETARAARAAIASLGLERICVGEVVDRDCLRRAADKSGATVASVPGAAGDLVVSTGHASPHPPLDAAPLSYNEMAFHYAAIEELWLGAPNDLNYDLVTAPGVVAPVSYRHTGRIAVHRLAVDVFVRWFEPCGCGTDVRRVWATWHHDGHAYAAWFALGQRDGTPAAFLSAVLPRVQYTAPTPAT
jgi:hypothetical protein